MLLKHSLAYGISRGIPGIISFLSVYIYSRIVTPGDYGQYAYLLAIVAFINVMFYQWLRLGVLRFLEVGMESISKERILASVFLSHLLTSLIVFVLLLVILIVYRDGVMLSMLPVLFFLVFFQSLYETGNEIIRSGLKPVVYGYSMGIRAATALLVTLLFLYFGYGVTGMLFGVVAGYVLTLLVLRRYLQLNYKVVFYEIKCVDRMMKYGIPLTLSLLCAYVINFSDRLMLGWFHGGDAMGRYVMGYDLIFMVIGLVFAIINTASFPIAVKILGEKGELAAVQSVQQASLLMMLLVWPMCSLVVLLSGNMSYLFFGDEYRNIANDIMPVVALAATLAGFKNFHYDLAFQLSSRTREQFKMMLMVVLSNLVFVAVLVPEFSHWGAAISVLCSYFIGMLMSRHYGMRYMKLLLHPDKYKILLAVIVMVVVIYPVREYQGLIWLALQSTIAMTAYFLVLFLLNVASLRDKLMLYLGKK